MQILKYFASNKNIKFLGHFFLIVLLVITGWSCNPTKYVPEGETLLDENKVIINRESVNRGDVTPFVKQKPNKRIFGVRFHLGLFNMSDTSKEKGFNNWLRTIGEEPVIFDGEATQKSKNQIKSYLASKGYFDAQVNETIETIKRKTKVYYNIDLNSPYTIRNLHYEIADTGLAKYVWFDTTDCLIERGKPYDVDILQAERSRLERSIRDLGFYNFSGGDDIYFRVDSSLGKRQVDIYYGIKKYLKIGPNNIPVLVPFSPYKMRNINILQDYFPKDVLSGGEGYLKSLDTVNYKGYSFITNIRKPTIRYDVILRTLYIRPGAPFNVSNSERSQSHLMSLKTYRLVNISYDEVETDSVPADGVKQLDCVIQLTPMSRQSFSVELEGTNSGGNLGGALNFVYQNKNLLRGAEQFNMKLKGAYETFSQSTTGIKSTREFGVETSLRLPDFLVPFIEKESFIKKYNPTTSIQAAYNYQNLPVYTRTVANASFGYLWNAGSFQTHFVSPLQLNLVKIPFIDPDYLKIIEKSSYLVNSYKNVLILGGSYSFIYNTQKRTKSNNFTFIRFNFETAGNLLRAFMKVSGMKMQTDTVFSHYNLLGLPYAQFIRTDIDYRYTRIINNVSSIVYRGFAGIGIPYRNSIAMPFEKQYFEGGANGIRGWQVRSLGPGSYLSSDTATFINQTGDIKIETNLEYRFKLFWILEGAVFVDAGNIWAIKNDPDRPGAQFKLNKFIDDFAIGAGFGMRFDLKFVVLRTDLGLKIRDPNNNPDYRWIFSRNSSNISKKDFGLVIAIGYPF
jgi:outer membrane protein assembly factor BamA